MPRWLLHSCWETSARITDGPAAHLATLPRCGRSIDGRLGGASVPFCAPGVRLRRAAVRAAKIGLWQFIGASGGCTLVRLADCGRR